MYDEGRAILVWKGFRRGNKQDYATLYEMHFALLYNYGFRMCGDASLTNDAIQQLFVKLWRRRKHLDASPAVKNYLLKSLRRMIIDLRQQHQRFVSDDTLGNQLSEEPYEFLVIQGQATQEQQACLQQSLSRLTPRQREAIYLKFYEGLSYEEISTTMSLTVSAAYNLVSKAISLLRKSTPYISLSWSLLWLAG